MKKNTFSIKLLLKPFVWFDFAHHERLKKAVCPERATRVEWVQTGFQKRSIALIIGLTLLPAALNAFWPFTESKPLSPREQELQHCEQQEQRVNELRREQADNPEDPTINYNFGVGLCNLSKINNKLSKINNELGKWNEAKINVCNAKIYLDDARTNFARALDHIESSKALEQKTDKALEQRCRFNIANVSLQQALSPLPDTWEQEAVEIDQPVLEQSIELSKSAVSQYEKILEQDKENKRATTNLKKAKEILEALEKKRKKQQQDNKQNKQDKNQQQNQDKQDQQQQSSDQNQQSQRDNQEKEGQKDGQQDERQGDGKRDPQQSQNKKADRENQKLEQQNDDSKQQKNLDHEQTPQKQEPSQSEPTKTGAEKQESAQEAASGATGQQNDGKETMEERSMRAILENLQSDEAKTQKNMLMRQQAKEQQKHPPVPGQKPW